MEEKIKYETGLTGSYEIRASSEASEANSSPKQDASSLHPSQEAMWQFTACPHSWGPLKSAESAPIILYC